LNRKRAGGFLAEAPGDFAANKGMSMLRLLRRGIPTGADRPERLVSDDDLGHGRGIQPVQAARELSLEHPLGSMLLALLERFPDQEDDAESGGQGCLDLAVDKGIALA